MKFSIISNCENFHKYKQVKFDQKPKGQSLDVGGVSWSKGPNMQLVALQVALTRSNNDWP